MLKKWKSILLNWINCYFNESGKDEQNLQLNSLHIIISHLRESFNLDESKSSILGAHTVQEFLLEKYPEFKFENGTVEAQSEDEVCIAASLLLFFVCVNSKDVDIKNAMCSRLSRQDQEIILKFSKNLMECSPILCRDVEAAITDACGQDGVAETSRSQVTVADTPPVLRSLHSEVRRLQAALDAEQFDRNYLQEELARTNLRVEQLLKDKEQYKLDILNLKAKLSQCSKQEEEVSNTEIEPDYTAKLTRELQEAEHQLIQTQTELNDVVSERDVYKSKVEELKKDRDKWLALSQQEAAQVTRLTEELETERCNVISLKELVSELQLHNKLNRVDSSLLECDDPDTSIQSFHHNSSVCSEACTNVIEVQLGEERAKITILEDQIQMLQVQLEDLNEKYVKDKQSYETILNERETDIFNLKHRINEEIEEKSNLKTYFDNEVTKLNNDVNELEQRLKGNHENSRSIIERKMQEIKILQEEKLSLLESLTVETTKNENIVKSLKEEIDKERRTKSNMKDCYENQIMKLNEKILNRNNELVELQNNILEKSEIMESLYLDLRKEKEMREEISNKYYSDVQQLNEQKTVTEQYLGQKSKEVTELKTIAEQKITLINDLQKEMSVLKLTLSNMEADYKYLEDTKEKLLFDIHNRDIKLNEIHKDIDSLKNLFSEEKEKLTHDLDEKNATINALKKQLQDEIHCKISFQNELGHLQKMNLEVSEELSMCKTIMQKNNETIKEMEICLQKEKEYNAKLEADCAKVNEYLNKATEDMNKKENELKSLCEKHENCITDLQEHLHHKEEIIEVVNEKLKTITEENESLRAKINLINNEKLILDKVVVEKNEKILELEADRENILYVVKEDKIVLEQKLMQISIRYKELEKRFNTETSKIITKLNETEKTIKELSASSKNTIKDKELEIQKLSLDQENAMKTIQNIQGIMSQIEKEKEALVEKLDEEIEYKSNFEKEYKNQCLHFNQVIAQLNDEVGKKKEEVKDLKAELASSVLSIEEKNEEIEIFKDKMFREVHSTRNEVLNKNLQIKEIMSELNDVELLNNELEQKLQEEKDCNAQAIQVLRNENEELQFIIEEDNNNHEVLLKEKDNIIDSIQLKLKNSTAQLETIKKHYEDLILTVDKFKLESQEKEEKIDRLLQDIIELKEDHNKIQKSYCEMNTQINRITKEKDKIEVQLKSRLLMAQETISAMEEKHGILVKEKDDLVLKYNEEKGIKNSLESEKINLLHENMRIFDDKKQLCNEKSTLMQDVLAQKSFNTILEEHKNNLLEEKLFLKDELAKMVKIKDALVEEKNCLAQQLIEEKSAIEMLMKEKIFLAQQLITEEQNNYKLREDLKDIIKKHTVLNEEYIKFKDENLNLENVIENLSKELKEEKSHNNELIKEKQSLLCEKESLEHEIIESKTINDVLMTDKGILISEKEALINSLEAEKSTLDEVENEKHTLKSNIEDLCKKHELELINKIEVLKDREEEISRLKIDYEDQIQNNSKISAKLNIALDKLHQNLKKEKINNEVSQEKIINNTSDMTSIDKCDLLFDILDNLSTELSIKKDLEQALEHKNVALNETQEMSKQKEVQIINLQSDIKRLEEIINEQNLETLKQTELASTTVNSKVKDIQTLEKENETLTNSLNDVKFQLEIKVHSLKEKLTDNENLTDKLRKSYECQIDNLNLMIAKLTNYLKDKTTELEAMRKENVELQYTVENNKKVIKFLEDEVKMNKEIQEKVISDFESERLVLKNMITVTESVMEDDKVSLNNIISQHMKENTILLQEKEYLKETIEKENNNWVLKLKEKDAVLETILKDLSNIKEERDKIRKEVTTQYQSMIKEVNLLKDELDIKILEIQALEIQNKDNTELQRYKEDIDTLEKQNNELKVKIDSFESEKQNLVEDLTRSLDEQVKINKDLEITLKDKLNSYKTVEEKVEKLSAEIDILVNEKRNIELECKEHLLKLDDVNVQFNVVLANLNKEIEILTNENARLVNIIEDNKTESTKLKQQTKDEIEENLKLCEGIRNEKITLMDKCSILQDYQVKAERLLEERQREINLLQKEIDTLKSKVESCEEDLIAKDGFISKISREKDEIINGIRKELLEEKTAREKIAASYMAAISARQNMEDDLALAIEQTEAYSLQNQDKKNTKPCSADDDRLLHQVDNNTSSDIAQSSTDSLKTISDLEKILDDKNRKITTLQTDITHLRSILAESETQLIDVKVELEMSKENCQQLSAQLKKIVYQKNEEIAELKRQINKMSVTENRATQIIKVSAKYQAIILKKIAEIKSNTVLKELTNFGNTNSCDELRRNLPGSVTMEDLENFLETTDRHLKRCTEKQASLQKERDRLSEVNRINESEIITLRKYLTEISLSYQTFSSVKDMYVQKLSRVLSIQRTVRREILNLDGHITPAAMCKLERGYAAIMQDLSECTMNLERWVERCITQTVTPEKIKQALLMSCNEPVSLSATSLQNTGLEVQIEELGNSFQKLLEDVARATRGDSAVDAQALTVTEVRAEYEDKLNRMKSKMNQLYHEQIGVFKEKQREEIALLKRELQKTRDKLAKSSEEYEEHIRRLTVELWRVGERFVVEKAEADDLRRKNRSGSLMSLQYVHSSGLAPPTLERSERPSDTYSLRSLPLDVNAKREGRDLHMSDEGEVFDNRCLKELTATPRRESQPPGLRLSELRWRNSLCPPHLKSSYPAETQFTQALDEEDIKSVGAVAAGKQQRKEVGITAYKKPGPPTPSKQAGRLSATGSELRDSLRVEADPHPSRKTSTPSKFRSFFRSSRHETNDGTPRSRKLSGFFRKM